MHDDDCDDEPSDDDGYVPCPHCGETMLEDAEYCPYCDRWITSEDQPPRKPWPMWVNILLVLMLAALILTALFGF